MKKSVIGWALALWVGCGETNVTPEPEKTEEELLAEAWQHRAEAFCAHTILGADLLVVGSRGRGSVADARSWATSAVTHGRVSPWASAHS